MKKLLIFFFVLFSFSYLNAQNVTISGTVTDLYGNPLNNHPVSISGDTSNINYNNIVFTNSNGFYNDVINSNGVLGSYFFIRVVDSCYYNTRTEYVDFNSPTYNYPNINFSICNTITSCNTSFTHGGSWNHFFNPSATGLAPFSYNWDFGDGSSSYSSSYNNGVGGGLYHSYPYSGGSYLTTLTVYDASGCSSTFSDSVFVAPYVSNCSVSMNTFPNSSNSDYYFTITVAGAAPPYGFNSLTIDWDMGDGTVVYGGNSSFSHNYSSPGIYTPCVTITDSSGCVSTACDTLYYGQNCGVTLSGGLDTGSIYAHYYANATGVAPFSYSYDYGNGNSITNSHGYGNNSYPNPGTYNVCVTVTDAQGCQSTDCMLIQRDSCSNISFSYQNANNNLVYFTPNLSSGQIYPINYNWDFGDGTTSNQANPTHTFTSNGFYQVCLTTTDSTGCTGVYCDTINTYGGNPSNCNTSFTYQDLGLGDVNFTSNTNPNTSIYSWDFGNGNISTQANPLHTYLYNGNYNVCLTTIDSNNCTSVYCDTITMNNASNCYLSVDFSGPPSNLGSYTKILNSTVTGANGAVSYYWDFGDGNTSTQANPTHTYSDTGFYQICLAAIDASGCIDSICYYTNVFDTLGNTSCNLDFSYQVNNTNGSVTFTSNVSGATNPITYLWDFDDGNTSTLANPTHTYTSSGNYLVTLSTVDSNGCQGYYCVFVSVQVGGVGYNCNANFTYNSNANGVIYFNNISTGGIAPVNYAWSFGDGNTGFGANPFHNYSASGWYLVCLGMTDVTGCYSYHCDSVYVQVTQSCSVDFTWQVDTTGTVAFNSNPIGGTAPYSYFWDFGDGTTSTLANPTHNYSNINNLSACLTVTDATGCIAYYCDTLNISIGNCLSIFTHQTVGNTVSFVPSAIGTGPFSYVWYFGDGSIATSANPNHTYTSNGTYNVCLAVLDATGCASTYCAQVVIQSAGSSCQSNFTYQNQGSGVVNFTSNVISGNPAFYYAWDFGDGTFASSPNPTHTYTNSGLYLACLVVVDSTGCASTYCDSVYIQSANTCSVSMNYYTIGNSDTFYFNVATTGVAPFIYSWDFGDGNTSTSANPYHVFNTSSQDTFNVCVTVVDANGCTATDCDWVTPPDSCNAPATFTYQVQNNGTVSFYSTASMLGAPIPFNYFWDFGDGNTSTQANPVYTYTTSGNYLVALTVTDSLTGCSSYYCVYVSVQVGGVGYTCDASFTYQSSANGLIYFSSNPTGIAPYTYSWDFGNNTSTSVANPAYAYLTTGYYTPCLTVIDATGCTATYCDSIYVQVPTGSCYADFTYQSFSNVGSTTVNFTSTGASSGNYSYNWTFGNGATSSNINPSTVYNNTGYYQVCLTTIDSSNCTAVHCDTIYVQVQTNSCNAQFASIDSSGYTFFINQSTGTVGMTTYSWDFGDGNTSSSYSPIHQYQNAGLYYACLTIVDNSGCTSTYCDSIYSYGIPNCDVTLTHSNITGTTTIAFHAITTGAAPFVYTWDFGDGNTYGNNSPYYTRQYQHLQDTTVYACVTITDATGCTSTDCNWVYIPDTTVNNCQIDFTYQTGVDGVVNFYANHSGGTAPYTFYWDMGDSSSHTLQNPSHTFPASGYYLTCVTIYDSVGCSYTYCDSVSVPGFTSTNKIEQLKNIVLFPNPVRDLLNIEFSIEQSTDVEIIIMNSTGQIVRQEIDNYYSGEQHLNISTSNLPNGVYLVRLKSDEEVFTRRFVKH